MVLDIMEFELRIREFRDQRASTCNIPAIARVGKILCEFRAARKPRRHDAGAQAFKVIAAALRDLRTHDCCP
jgi:hypothetical protein